MDNPTATAQWSRRRAVDVVVLLHRVEVVVVAVALLAAAAATAAAEAGPVSAGDDAAMNMVFARGVRVSSPWGAEGDRSSQQRVHASLASGRPQHAVVASRFAFFFIFCLWNYSL
jgi:hypothetical protein